MMIDRETLGSEPAKPNVIQLPDPFFRQFAILHFTSIPILPTGQLQVFRIRTRMRHITVPISNLEGDQILNHFIPELLTVFDPPRKAYLV